MKSHVIFLGVCMLVLTAHAQRPAQGPVSARQFDPLKAGYKLIWDDNFNGTSLDSTKWKLRGIGPRAIAYVSPGAVKVEDGFLKLFAFKRHDTLFGSAVGTQDLFMNSYGYYECRAQVQASKGIWAAFWIQSPFISQGEDPATYGAEIDIMECFRKLGLDIVSHNVHWAYGPHQQTTHGMQSYLPGVGKGFHRFAVEWTPGNYIFYVDGLKFYEVDKGISHINEYMILSMEYPNTMEEIEATQFPDVFLVDWVRVYRKL